MNLCASSVNDGFGLELLVVGKRLGVRHVHQQLFVGIAAEFGLSGQSLVPCLFTDLAARPRRTLVERVDGAKVDLLVDVVLEGGRDIVAMVVSAVRMSVIMAVAFVFVVAVRHYELMFEWVVWFFATCWNEGAMFPQLKLPFTLH